MRLLVTALLFCVVSPAQTTWVVNAGGGAGVHFASLPAAVQAASDGDTIIVQTGPFLEGATPFTTSKGLTIVGEGGEVPIATSISNAIEVVNLPAGSSFRMVGFSRNGDGALNVRISNCQGKVHLDRIRCRENSFFLIGPSTVIENSANVTLREFDTHGAPCVQITDSRVSLVRCRLGETYIGLGGGQAIDGDNSTIAIVEPKFDSLFVTAPTIVLQDCDTRIAGSVGSYVRGPGNPVVVANGGSLMVDPAVDVAGSGASAPFQGTAAPTFVSLPASSTEHAIAGQSLVLHTSGQAASLIFQAIGQPGFLTDTPFGTLGLDALQGYAFLPMTMVPALGPAVSTLALPATLPVGSAYTTQAAVFQSGQLRISEPCTFIVH